jgi:hypothetical protein
LGRPPTFLGMPGLFEGLKVWGNWGRCRRWGRWGRWGRCVEKCGEVMGGKLGQFPHT